jgi:hypothetical protein
MTEYLRVAERWAKKVVKEQGKQQDHQAESRY